MAKYVENFNDWALGMYDEYMRILKNNRTRWTVGHYTDTYSIVTTLTDLKRGKCGSAKVWRKDYDEKIGIGVAWARLREYEVPKERKPITLKELSNGEKFCVPSNTRIIFTKIGEIPSTTRIVIYDEEDGGIAQFNKDMIVYKIN